MDRRLKDRKTIDMNHLRGKLRWQGEHLKPSPVIMRPSPTVPWAYSRTQTQENPFLFFFPFLSEIVFLFGLKSIMRGCFWLHLSHACSLKPWWVVRMWTHQYFCRNSLSASLLFSQLTQIQPPGEEEQLIGFTDSHPWKAHTINLRNNKCHVFHRKVVMSLAHFLNL